ncbi:four helix bundle protein [Candidatus Uhrbacteria bacterium]|nr:four helix bundle protein [Candidatus Uhrbacteria bacterium]
MEERYLDKVKRLADEYAHLVYKISKQLPNEEKYGITSQLNRVALSVALNVVEGYTRRSDKDFLRFIEIAHGSLKESDYLLGFCVEESLLIATEVQSIRMLADNLAAMLWGILKNHKS